MVRRDWAILSADMSSQVLDFILAEGRSREDVVTDIHSYLRQMSDAIRNKQVPLEKFIITKGISKNPEEYPDKKYPIPSFCLYSSLDLSSRFPFTSLS